MKVERKNSDYLGGEGDNREDSVTEVAMDIAELVGGREVVLLLLQLVR